MADQGDKKVQNSLGVIYQKRECVPKDSEKDKEYFEKAAAQGLSEAQRILNEMKKG